LAWDVEGTDEFEAWFTALSEGERESVAAVVGLLEASGPSLRFPRTSRIVQSRHNVMRELRIQHQGRPIRVLYAFDPRRTAVLLLGGDKTGDERWYDKSVPIADDLYDELLRELRSEGLI
jgi:hypothetical protein